jgi:hypothetical protein
MPHTSFPLTAADGTIASYYLYGLESGLFPLDCAKEWAFQIIQSRDTPPIEIIEVATATQRQDVFDSLASVPGPRDTQVAGQCLFLHLHDKLQAGGMTVRAAVLAAMQIARRAELSDSIYYDFDALEDELYLAEDGSYSTVAVVTNDVLSALSSHGQPAPGEA